MVNFIPAWYQNSEWKEREQYWYYKRTHTEMDDTVKQIQLFHRNKISDYRILLLSFAPNFRHFLHRQGIFRANYISMFDLIQEIDLRQNTMFSYRQLNWPKDIEFVYTPFVIVAMLNGEKYAQIEFDEDGRAIEISFFFKEQLTRKNIYDDRGFLSLTTVYENGKLIYDQYLSQTGVWKICHFSDGHVEVNPDNNCYNILHHNKYIKYKFNKPIYNSLEELLEEIFLNQTENLGKDDIYVIAAHNLHQRMVSKVLRENNTIYSLFADRFLPTNGQTALINADAIICDSEKMLQKISGILTQKKEIYHIPPYGAREDHSFSQTLHTQNILLAVDYLSEAAIGNAVLSISEYLLKNDKAMVHLFTRHIESERERYIMEIVEDAVITGGYPAQWCHAKTDLLEKGENAEEIRFVIKQCVDELSVNRCIREQRVVIDLSEIPDMFLQIACLGMGVPQLLKVENEYMQDGANGKVIANDNELSESISFYLDNISNWNKGSIASNEIKKQHTAGTLESQWKEVLKSFEK